jgi:hypothetical protein
MSASSIAFSISVEKTNYDYALLQQSLVSLVRIQEGCQILIIPSRDTGGIDVDDRNLNM